MIYVSSACVKEKSIAEVIKQLAGKGIKNIELSGGTDYYCGIMQDLEDLKRTYHLNYACHAYFPPPPVPFVVNLASCNDKIYRQSLEHYIQCIEMMKSLECRVLSIHAGFLVEINTEEIGHKVSSKTVYDEEKAYDRFCTAYEHIAELCKKNNMDLFLENNVLSAENYEEFGCHNYMMMTDYESIRKMQRQLDFHLLLDLGHLHVSANTLGLNYSEQCRELTEYVKWIHVSENNGKVDGHKPLRAGSMIMEEFKKMYQSGMDVTLETVGNMDEILAGMELLKMEKK